ncbi:PAP2 superfamily-domain-containing protein [Emericellopsis atlantica]|uniref:PAP2 superfamily-domain-containing protein n=1 Tax=Emericellopsis atlantica TaxID=2614577 RepID=A0A9P7ZMN4_9HYPO|nr:PAP2 superfamily-domain-containing protein [Emericellopsis atlantica]KAG9254522.1 PAP2 superfamily-domain-containing protein [Emericellopsis atlantica]
MAQPNLGKPQPSSHTWVEPIVVIGIMIASCYINRQRRKPADRGQGLFNRPNLDLEDEPNGSNIYDEQELLFFSVAESSWPTSHGRKSRLCCGFKLDTVNTSQFATHWHSRVLEKFPFLVEMFYWALNFSCYAAAKAVGETFFANGDVWQMAEKHGIAVLWFEQDGPFKFLFPFREVDVQHFFMSEHQGMLTLLNRTYSLVHIPATVGFLGWYYYSAPTHSHFAAVRRMMTLTNILSFVIFTFWPCMPPRLLPKEYGFFDTVRREDAQSVWASGKFFNQLAAFPSLHFGYAFCVGATLIFHSGVFRRQPGPRGKQWSRVRQGVFVFLGVLYPAFVLTIIVATANHYWLDALAAAVVVALAWKCNRVLLGFLPLEDLFLWCIRLKKPFPTTGSRL